MKRIFFLLVIYLFSAGLNAQQVQTIRGIVTDNNASNRWILDRHQISRFGFTIH